MYYSKRNCINIVSHQCHKHRKVPQLITEYKNQNSGIINTYDCDLLILNENKYLTYCIINKDQQYEILREYKMSPDEHFNDFHTKVLEYDEYLRNGFKSVKIGISNKRLVLVPGAVFRREQSVHYLENSAPIWSTDEVKVDYLEKQDIRLIYAFRTSVYQMYKGLYPNSTMENALSSYITHVDRIVSSMDPGYKVYVNALYDTLYIVVFRNEQLAYANVYEFTTAEDFLYYIMLIYKEFQLDQEKTPTFISGKMDSHSKLHDLISRYIRNLHFLQQNTSGEVGIEGLPEHIYFDLFSLRA